MAGCRERIDLSALAIIKGCKVSSPEGLTILPAPEGVVLELAGPSAGMGGVTWTPEKFVVLELQADMQSMARIDLNFFAAANPGETVDLCLNYAMIPNHRVRMAVRLDELASRRFFLPTYPGSYKGHVLGKPTHISRMNRLRIGLKPGRDLTRFTLYDLHLSDRLPDFTVAGAKMVDELGQYKGLQWAGKTPSVAALVAYLSEERRQAAADNGYPQGWSRYGGWLEKRFDATGFFHPRHDGRRWWLVDPDGYAFISNGVCYGSRMGVHGFVHGMEELFDWLPDPADPTYAQACTTADCIAEFVKRNGTEAGRGRRMVNFARTNLIRAFGTDWWNAWVDINAARLKRWGFNTVGVGVNNYFDEKVMEFLGQARIPYVWTLKAFPQTAQAIFRDFPDVFSPEYARNAAVFAQQLAPFVRDPYMIGYFINNEPEWLFQASVNLAERLLASPHDLAAKTPLVEFLQRRYGGDIGALNAAWGTALASFADLRTPLADADRRSEAARRDLEDFSRLLVDQYGRVTSEALHAVDPDHLNLGMRYAYPHEKSVTGFTYFDVFSFNRYTENPVPELERVARMCDKPLLIGEWHVGGSDKGLLANGLVAASNQTERGLAYAFYLENAAVQPAFVGGHYFEFNDQPVLGRFDGECMQHGLIDVCNRPYDEMIAAVRQTNRRVYALADGRLAPTSRRGQLVERF